MLTPKDIRGVCAMIPTPSIDGGGDWRVENSVDLEETARITEDFIRDGIGLFAVCGTTGECAALLWEEKLAFTDTIVQVTAGRVPVFAGATALGTKETIRQMRAFKDAGADGAFVGLPLWQTPTAENSVQWFADLGEAVPDMPIMVYSNSMFFKSMFPVEFWEGVAKRAPTVITNKIASPVIGEHLEEIIRVTHDQISFLPLQNNAASARERVGDKIRGLWSTAASMGPEPVVALWDAIENGNKERLGEIQADLAALPPAMPADKRAEDFPKYNAQLNKVCTNASDYMKGGPLRAPYEDLPDEYRQTAEATGKAWAQLRKKYAKAAV